LHRGPDVAQKVMRGGGEKAVPTSLLNPSAPEGASHIQPSDFASVFFSPLPFSYLNAAHSNSTEHLADSPDVTLRAGRLTVCVVCMCVCV